jgi:hypothetical protein
MQVKKILIRFAVEAPDLFWYEYATLEDSRIQKCMRIHRLDRNTAILALCQNDGYPPQNQSGYTPIKPGEFWRDHVLYTVESEKPISDKDYLTLRRFIHIS